MYNSAKCRQADLARTFAVEHLVKAQDLLAAIDKESSSSNIRSKNNALRAHIRGMAQAAADFERRARRRIDSLLAQLKVRVSIKSVKFEKKSCNNLRAWKICELLTCAANRTKEGQRQTPPRAQLHRRRHQQTALATCVEQKSARRQTRVARSTAPWTGLMNRSPPAPSPPSVPFFPPK